MCVCVYVCVDVYVCVCVGMYVCVGVCVGVCVLMKYSSYNLNMCKHHTLLR